jgi:uncharacterized protein (DUF58 family)
MLAEARGALDPAAVARLASLELIARTLVDGFIKGLHFSPAKGSSTEFAEHRPYVAGDDIRGIDWKTFGKTDRFYVKEYEDETNARATLVVDASASMDFGTSGITKHRYAVCLAAAAGYLLLGQRDAVGLATVSSGLHRVLPPKATPQHLRGVLALLESEAPRGETRLAEALHLLAERLHPGSIVLVVSDFLDDPQRIMTSVAHLRHRRAEVLLLHLIDPAEVDLPFTSWTVFRDPESPGTRLRLDARQVRALYLENLAAHQDALRKGAAALEVDYAVLNTSQAFDAGLAAVLQARSRRRR